MICMQMMPKGNSDFKDIRHRNLVYVDKTRYIELLENASNKSVHFLRPRRFGKSLFTSMLDAYYDVNAKDEFEELFNGTYIYIHPTKEKNSYYILRFDFSGLNTRSTEILEKEIADRVYDCCMKFLKKYQINLELEKRSAAGILSQLLSMIDIKPLYVIIDEYDHFANELLSFPFDDFHNAVSKNGYVRKFYEVLKTGTVDSTIGKIFITGVSPITLDSMTSGFNISTNLSLDSRFNEMLGFTSEEVKCLISMVRDHKYEEQIFQDMKQIYDGYMFTREGTHHVFDPNMSVYYLDHIQSFQKPPLEIVDPNIYSDYKKIENILNIKPDLEHREALEEILAEKDILTHLTTSFELSKRFTKSDFFSLLYYLGYLTIGGTRGMRVKLIVPNDVIRNVYFDYFNEMLRRELHINTDGYVDAIDNILYDKDNTLFVSQMEEILHSLDHRDYIGLQEKGMKIAAMAIAKANASALVKSEYAVPNGYIDLVLFPYQIEGVTALIELKYIKKKDFTKELLQEKRDEAELQLQNYQQAKEFQNKDVIKWILIFCKDQCVWNETLDEQTPDDQ